MMKNAKIFFRKNRLIIGSLGLLATIILFFLFQAEKPTSLNGMLRTGNELLKSGKLALALNNYNKLVRLYPKSYDAHLRLGDLYVKLANDDKEDTGYREKAKIEYYRAMDLGEMYRYDANFAMANLYCSQNNYDLAEQVLLPLKDVRNKKIQEKLGDFYNNWANHVIKQNPIESIRKYKIAYNYYKNFDMQRADDLYKQIDITYSLFADKLLASQNEDEAIRILHTSLDFDNSPLAHYKLAKIYENKNIDKALDEYKIAFKLNRYVGLKENYINLLFKKASLFNKEGKPGEAELIYKKIKILNPNSHIPSINMDKLILVNLTSTKYNADPDKDVFIPGLSLRVTNIGKDKINYLKAKIVFLKENGKNFSEIIQQISSQNAPLEQDKTSSEITIFSPKSLEGAFVSHDIQIQVYLSQKQPDKWRLFRTAFVSNKNNPTEPLN